MTDTKVWGIHTKDDNLFFNENVIAIGWHDMGDISVIQNDRELLKQKYPSVYPNKKPGAAPTDCGQIFRFINEAKIGDYVVFPSKIDRKINIGQIIGDATYNSNTDVYPRRRKVKWLKRGLARTSFSQGALYEIGSAMTFFSVKNYADEFISALSGTNILNDTEDESEEISLQADSIIETTRDYVLKQLSTNLKGYPLEDLVADLLGAMGYKVTQSSKGGDRGIDIIIYKDELPPRIVVQVKSFDRDVPERDVQALKGAMNNNDYGLFVTLSDYSENAKKYLNGHTEIRGIDGRELVDLLLQYYDKLSDKYRTIIPLKRVYIPDVKE
ncbi:MAG: restriction endonuclease [Treponema sp.]|nr:restriction endonuclease [Treponema sp.]MCR5318048.1 restriction endonuclease [Treponema sp.]